MPIVEVPGMGDVEFPDDMNDEQIAAAIRANMPKTSDASLYNKDDERQKAGLRKLREGWRQVGLTGRTIMDTFAGPPLAAMDAGVAGRNALTGGNYQMPSQMWNEALNSAGVPQPQNMTEKGVNIAGQVLLGSKLPAPQASSVAPPSFKPETLRNMVLKQSQDAGYVVPPATANPSATNKVLEGVAGKQSTAQLASAMNQSTTNALAKKALGVSGEITEEALRQARADAYAKGYEPLRAIGIMRADAQYATDLEKVASAYRSAGKDFPALAKKEIVDLVEGMKKKSFDSANAVDAVRVLRESADDAYRAGNSSVGKAYKEISKALENAMERSLARRGKDGADLLRNFRESRQLIAKTHSVQSALNASTANVSATKLVQQLGKGKLSGELRQIAQFGQAFPKAARVFDESLPGVSPLDFYASGGIAAATQNPASLAYPFMRQAWRAGLLSPSGQRLLTQQAGPMSSTLPMGAAYGLLNSGQ